MSTGSESLFASRAVRVDADVKAALDRIRDQYGDNTYGEAIRRVLRWRRIVDAPSDVSDDVYRLWKGNA